MTIEVARERKLAGTLQTVWEITIGNWSSQLQDPALASIASSTGKVDPELKAPSPEALSSKSMSNDDFFQKVTTAFASPVGDFLSSQRRLQQGTNSDFPVAASPPGAGPPPPTSPPPSPPPRSTRPRAAGTLLPRVGGRRG